MLTEYEARKLRESMKQELNETAAALVFKCAVYLLLFIGLAWLGATREAPSALRVQPLERQALAQPDPASKAVFEDRRERYVRANPGSQVAREHRMQRQQDAHADGGYFAYQSE